MTRTTAPSGTAAAASPAAARPASDQPSVRISEIFLSLQGEGPSAGTPAHFVRLQGCDVGCAWCDSKYTWPADGGRAIALDDVWREAEALGTAPLVVVTGGEPLEHDGVAILLAQALERWPRVEVETSGVEPPPLHHARLHYNVSPKLPSVTPEWERTWAHARAWIAEPNAVFKLVVGGGTDVDDALRLIETHALPAERVLLMPEGLTDAEVKEHALALVDVCKRHGFRLSPRLHVWMWGPRRGV